MTEPEFDLSEDYEGIQPKMANVPRSQVRKWEKQAKELAEAQAQLTAMQRQAAFIRAGIPEDGAGKYFIKGYDGPDDPESIRAAAIEAGIIKEPADQQQQVATSLDGHDQAANLAAGATNPNAGVDVNALMRAAKNKDELLRLINEHVGTPDQLGLTGRLQDR